jgi:hypothetical protein
VRYWEALEAEATAMAEADGSLALTSSVVILTATA